VIRRLFLALMLGTAGCTQAPLETPPSRAQPAEPHLPPARRFAPADPVPPQRSNQDIARDFLDLHFRLEGGTELPYLTRFEGPVTVQVTGAPPAGMYADLDALLLRLRSEAGIPVTRTSGPGANITIQAVPRAEIRRTLPHAACFVVPNVSSLSEYRRARRSGRTSWPELRTRDRLAIFVPNDTSPQDMRDCLHEELAQALGPLNDLYRLPDSIFNDDNVHTVLTGFDMLILRAGYAPELATGMTRSEVAAKLPAILARLNPRGQGRTPRPLPETPQNWAAAIETALVPETSPAGRLRAASAAAATARSLGWTDHRRAFSHYTLGRVILPRDPVSAAAHFRTALKYLPEGQMLSLHRAHVSARLAGQALQAGRPGDAMALIRPAAEAAARGQNAALLATLRLQEAEALDLMGRPDQARAVRLDSLGWARYGFGPEWAEHARQQELAALRASATQAKTR
jgi:hypothetical protein